MPEPMQAAGPRPPRAERTTTSCGECRRRKQKCNQGQPCSNCARRFPQPACEYKPGPRRPSAAAVPQRPAFSVSLTPPPLASSSLGLGAEVLQQQQPIPQPQPLLSSWDRDAGRTPPDWSAFSFLGQFPTLASPGQFAWSTDQQSLPMCIIACEDGCAAHSDEVHDAIRILHAYRSTQSSWANSGWIPGYSAWTVVPAVSPAAGGIPWSNADGGQDLVQVPLAPAMRDAELLLIYVKFISQFTASLDGKPDASNPYIKHYVPYCINSQLLVHVAIYSAACFLTDTGHIERTVAMAHKGHAIKLLNEHIRSQTSTSDEVIAGVIQLVLAEWLWGNTHDLRAHLRGLREMIRFRGGFRLLGLHGLMSKLAITADVAIALCSEVSPFLRGGAEFEFRDNVRKPLRLALNTPMISTLVPFSSCADDLRLDPAVASMLDDMRFLLAAVLALPEKPSAKELQKVHTTSAWIHERISGLPEECPSARDAPAVRRASTASSTTSPEYAAVPQPRGEQQPHARLGRSPRQQPLTAPVQTPAALVEERHRATPHPPSPAPPRPAAAEDQQPGTAPDYVYQAVRLAALLYSRAVMHRRPFSQVVTPAEFLQLWTTAWRVPLSTWRSLLGVLSWILLPILPAGKVAQPHDRFVKGVFHIGLFQMGMDDWEIACSAMGAALSLQRWLAGALADPAGPPPPYPGGGGTTNRSGAGESGSKARRESAGEQDGFGDKGKGKEFLYGQVSPGC